MTRSVASGRVSVPAGPDTVSGGPSRRELLLDSAAELLAQGHTDEVTIESVASRAGVSRALVYKHFAHRRELLEALYERESSLLHRQLRAAVESAGSLDDMFRALVGGALAAQASRSATFVALAAEGARPSAQTTRQRRRDGITLRYFTQRAVAELGLDAAVAEPALRLALSGIANVLAAWRRDPTPARAQSLSDIYVRMTIGGLRSLAADPPC